MDRKEVQEIILRVLSETNTGGGAELPLEFPVEVSAKHVHLTEEAVEKLFGKGATLTPKRALSQPGQFLSEERVVLATAKGTIENVAVLGPVRPAIQTELSMTDCKTLGIKAPLRMSGDLSGAADVNIIGPCGVVEAKGSAIVAKAHIHLTHSEAEQIGIQNGQTVRVTLGGERSVTLNEVVCRVDSPEKAALAMHVDFDEANACMLPKNATAKMVKVCGKSVCSASKAPAPSGGVFSLDEKVITEEIAKNKIVGRTKKLTLKKGMILTPSAKDVLHHAGIEIAE